MRQLLSAGQERWLSGPYLERREKDDHRVDRWLMAALEGAALKAAGRPARLAARADRVLQHESAMRDLSDSALAARAQALRAAFLRQGLAAALVDEALALARDAARRRLGLSHHKVQVMGALALVEGMLAEMSTGEGKTITAQLAASALALAGFPVHVVTVNDYLALRDGTELASSYALLGLTTGIVQNGQSATERRDVYAHDIVYATNKELAFDYLRDRLSLGQRRSRAELAVSQLDADGAGAPLLMRGLGYALVDEADSVLVDEARTPLIISAPEEAGEDRASLADALALARRLSRDRDFVLSSQGRQVALTPAGRAAVDSLSAGRDGLWRVRRARHELATQALTALLLFEPDRHYIVDDGKVKIVDEFTGRVAEGRSWERGLQQLIEVKEGVEPSERRTAEARITYQRFFRRYLRLAGMTATAAELAGEFRGVYGLRLALVPPHRPSRRLDQGASFFGTADAKWQAIALRCAALQSAGRAVLVGTRSVAASEQLGAELDRTGVAHAVLNARQDGQEAAVIAAAGGTGRVTVATNMAGRGTDIRLAPGVADQGGLHVILSEFHESARIDRQLFGRGGRQGDPGSTEAIVALDDELFLLRAPGLRRLALGFGFDADGRSRAPRRLLGALRRMAQAASERDHASARRQTERMDREFRRALSFAGLPE